MNEFDKYNKITMGVVHRLSTEEVGTLIHISLEILKKRGYTMERIFESTEGFQEQLNEDFDDVAESSSLALLTGIIGISSITVDKIGRRMTVEQLLNTVTKENEE